MTTQMAAQEIDWYAIGKEVRDSALDAHEGSLPSVEIGWSFMKDNMEIFLETALDACDDPENLDVHLPDEPPSTFVTGYMEIAA